MSTIAGREWGELRWSDTLTPALVGYRVRARMVDDEGNTTFTATGLLVVVQTEATTVKNLAGYHMPASRETRVVLTCAEPGDVDVTLTFTAGALGYIKRLDS